MKIKQLKLGHLNVYYINQKLHDIAQLIDKNDIDIFGLSETKLTQNHSDISLNIPSYSYYRRNKEKTGEGGILVYYKNSLAPYIKRRTDLEEFDIECIWVELKFTNNPPILICNMYRNGKSDDTWFFKFADMIEKIKLSNHEIILLGDFNINLFEEHPFWESTITLFKLKQLIQSPTRICDTTSTLIDHIYTNFEDKISNAHVSNSGISDHFPIFCTYLLKVPKPYSNSHMTIESRSFKKFDPDAFLNDLAQCNFSKIYYENDPDAALNLFYNIFIPLLDKHAPIIKRRIKNRVRPEWLSNDIIEEMNKRDKLSNNKQSKEYKKQRNKVTSMVRKAKKTYYNKLIESNENIATLWKVTNQILGKNASKSTAQSNLFTADEFNNYFTSLANDLIETNYGQNNDEYTIPEYFEKIEMNSNKEQINSIPLLTENDTFKYIKQLKNKKSSGTDNISTYFLKLALPFINTPLTHIYNTCIVQGVFPNLLKQAKVIPLPKCKNPKELNNYRPISLLNILSKPLEKHIHKHISTYFENNNLFYFHQSGFRQKHSCHSASIRIIDTWLNNINNNKINGAVFLDLKKAFDLVNHSILIQKLSYYLKNPSIIALLQSYLSNRSQVVLSNCTFSSRQDIKCGVPQGSILGPLLFCIYINDLPQHISNPNVELDLFADDSSLHTAADNIESINESLQVSLTEVEDWCKINKMILHPDKSKCMIITTHQKRQLYQHELKLKIDNKNIEQVKKHKLLGIIIDQNLTWDDHINQLCKQLSQNLFLLYKLKPYLNTFALKIFFNAHIISKINYSQTVWCHAATSHIKKIDSLYRRGIKMISNEKNISTTKKTLNLNFLPLEEHFIYNSILLTFKIQNNLSPKYLKQFITISNRTNSSNLMVPYARIEKFKISFSFTAPKHWNLLPKDIRGISKIGSFKNAVKKYLISKSLSS